MNSLWRFSRLRKKPNKTKNLFAGEYKTSFRASRKICNRYLWILSRTPVIDRNVRNVILAEVKRRGYDTNKLIWVEQSKIGYD